MTVQTNPTGQTCTVANGTGTIGSANVTNVAVTCTANDGAASASDDFNRAERQPGPELDRHQRRRPDDHRAGRWRAPRRNADLTGDIRTAETYTGRPVLPDHR